ncbi:alpha/beta hydrolase [Ruficoccus amylovorans]|uniref:Alpha/beta hydrolase n=1 Tax=Ruficoccus amylovorans TaxID=1804625 RepID=A0A842HAZ1_9BACT|nr:alpha/beta hydrolase [Ruficoccus amylovorans]MBC2593545.1 alpha/beta hydrolase [Ruficoccus amylovorans]
MFKAHFARLVIPCLASLLTMTSLYSQSPTPDTVIPYKDTTKGELTLSVFYPEGHKPTDKTPAIVFFFGGGWVTGGPSQFYSHCEYLASRGIVAIAAQYRTKNSHGTTPQEAVMDGKSAMRWVRAHAAELGIDPDRIAAGGGSAGGQVAAATALAKGFDEDSDTSVSCRPDALVLFNPVIDNGPGGYGHDRVKEYWEAFSPMNNIDADAPPTVIFLGTKDNLIPVSTAETYKTRMEQNGVRCDLHLYQDQTHGFFNTSHPEHFYLTLLETDKFLTSLGYLQGDPTLQPPTAETTSPAAK